MPRPHCLGGLSAALVATVLLAGLAGCTGTDPDGPGRHPDRDRTQPPAPPESEDGLQEAYQEVVGRVLPSVVQIEAEEGLGSGIVYDTEGHVVTNAHVVGKSEEVEVTLATGEEPAPATLVFAYQEQDLAVVRLDDPPDQLRPATFGDSGRLEVGQIVLAMGNPLGLSSSVTQGIVSAVGRAISEGEGPGAATLGDLVQTSAAINPGNSGGALVDLGGNVIGVPTVAARDPQLGGGAAPGIGFAIPAATVTHLADQMIEHGRVIESGRAALGVTVRTILGEGFEPAGAAVVETADGGPADEAGIRPGDVLIRLGSAEITDVMTLAEELAAQDPEDAVEITYRRAGERKTTEVILAEAD